MGKDASSATMSLDGYIAFDDDTVGALFDWYDAGDVEVTTAHPDLTFHLTRRSADYWGGRHPIDLPVVVVTHAVPTEWVERFPDAPFTFVTEGVAAGIAAAQEI